MNINLALDVDNSVDDVDNASLKRTKLSFAIIDWIEFLRIEEHVSMLEMELNHLKENAKKNDLSLNFLQRIQFQRDK